MWTYILVRFYWAEVEAVICGIAKWKAEGGCTMKPYCSGQLFSNCVHAFFGGDV